MNLFRFSRFFTKQFLKKIAKETGAIAARVANMKHGGNRKSNQAVNLPDLPANQQPFSNLLRNRLTRIVTQRIKRCYLYRYIQKPLHCLKTAFSCA
ncbi:MAG: hypothetical protein DRP37_07835 [Thermodesulfobacteriota bacterium]|nr:MAG: hypothetical protein DRP37_07835 [Thermodesulfobacteriota bacterium]